jgi:hypothetical protein
MQNKTSKKNPINFNDFWPLLKAEAVKKGYGKVEWLTRSGLNYQRYSEFDTNTRDVSGRYFLKLMGGLNLKLDNTEKKLGRKFTAKQKECLQFEAQVDANKEWLQKLLSDPETIKICKSIVDAKKK